jgi:hypothetical protein
MCCRRWCGAADGWTAGRLVMAVARGHIQTFRHGERKSAGGATIVARVEIGKMPLRVDIY